MRQQIIHIYTLVESLLNSVKQLLRRVRSLLRRPAFLLGVIGLRYLPAKYRTVHPLLQLIRFGWGNPWAAGTHYIQAMIAYVNATRGTILECGSGLTTFVLASTVDTDKRNIISLEHDIAWHSNITDSLSRFSMDNVPVQLAPIRDYGDFHWYDLTGIHIPEGVELVICDGPPGSTPGGRYGLLPALESKMASNCVILLDDVERSSERFVLERWAREYDLTFEVHTGNKAFASLRLEGNR